MIFYTDLSQTNVNFWTGYPLNQTRDLHGLTTNQTNILHQSDMEPSRAFTPGWDQEPKSGLFTGYLKNPQIEFFLKWLNSQTKRRFNTKSPK